MQQLRMELVNQRQLESDMRRELRHLVSDAEQMRLVLDESKAPVLCPQVHSSDEMDELRQALKNSEAASAKVLTALAVEEQALAHTKMELSTDILSLNRTFQNLKAQRIKPPLDRSGEVAGLQAELRLTDERLAVLKDHVTEAEVRLRCASWWRLISRANPILAAVFVSWWWLGS